MISENDTPITNMSTPHGYHDYLNIKSGITYRIAIENEPQLEDDEWQSISLNPFVYPEEVVSMTYEI